MARIVLGPLVNDIRGSIGNQVFDNYNGVHIIRAKPSYTTNPQSEAQSFVRSTLAILNAAWKDMDLEDQLAWKQLAIYFPQGKESDAKLSRGGLVTIPRGPFSGWNAFLACNMNRFISQAPVTPDVLTYPVIGEELPEPLKKLSATAIPGKITVYWQYITPGTVEEWLQIWIKSVDAFVHPQIIYQEKKDANGCYEITSVKSRGGLRITPPRGTYKLQAQIIDQWGMCSQPSSLVQVKMKGDDVFTYFTTRQTALSLVGVAGDIAWTEIDMSAFIPSGAHSVIFEIEASQPTPTLGQYNNFKLRKDTTQGVSAIVAVGDQAYAGIFSDNGVMSLQTGRKIEYAIEDSVGVGLINIAVYILGYIS